MANSFNFNFNKTLMASAFLHAGFFVTAILLSAKAIQPLPLGVELAYQAPPTRVVVPTMPTTAEVAKKSAVSIPLHSQDDVTVKAKEVPVEAVAPTAVASSTSGSSTGALSGREGVATGAEVSAEERYLYELKKLLERRKSYPMMARKMGHAGTVVMRFTLKADGTLVGSEVVEKAPYESLNQAAATLVEGINGMKPFPQEIRKDTWSITVPIEYTLR